MSTAETDRQKIAAEEAAIAQAEEDQRLKDEQLSQKAKEAHEAAEDKDKKQNILLLLQHQRRGLENNIARLKKGYREAMENLKNDPLGRKAEYHQGLIIGAAESCEREEHRNHACH